MKKIYLGIMLSFVTILTQAQCLVTASGTNIQCNGQCNGTATATPVGVPPFNYLWSPGSMTTQTITGLCAGTYTVNVIDATSCMSTGTVTIVEPSAISSTVTTTNVACNGACNGSATAFASGGTGAYTHKWNTIPAQTSATANNLCPGVYYDTIKDANGCMMVSSAATITEPSVLTVTPLAGSVSCFGGSNGTATANASGGTPGYTYLWSTPSAQTTATISGLTAGTYSCTVTDSKGCSQMVACVVNQPASAVAVSSTSSNATCSTCCDGSASSTVSGGTPGYTYMWTPGGQTTAAISAVCPGSYTVCVTDANGCSKCDSVSVNFTVGINEIGLNDLHVYPNPTSDNIQIEFSVPASTELVFTLYDVIGNGVYAEKVSANGTYKKSISLQTLPAGVYFLRTGVAGKYITQKIIKY